MVMVAAVMPGLVQIPRGDTPIEQAFTGLCLAINAVIEADHVVHLRDWDDRRNRLLEWREHLNAHPIPDAHAAGAAIGRGDMNVTQALFGTERWEEMLTDLQEMMQWTAERHSESARKMSVLQDAINRAPGVRRRGDERVQQILRSAERKIKKLHDDDVNGRRRIIEAGQREVQTISAVAVKRTNAFTRQVLDLDENTAAIGTQEWLRRHGLDTREA
jgi:hypothetical protein